jgi:hypothetical protein
LEKLLRGKTPPLIRLFGGTTLTLHSLSIQADGAIKLAYFAGPL